jgi:defect-in-organelle-trafficking protein DotC
MKSAAIIALMTLSLLTACAHHTQNVDSTNMQSLQSMSSDNTGATISASTSQLRGKALEDTAMSVGARGGLAWASEKINERLTKDRWYLETIYNFNGMMLSHGVLPPVLAEGDNSLNLADSDTIRVADKSYQILQQAQFVTTPPNWREYIWMTYTKPELPNRILLPRNKEEQQIWRKAIQDGWQKGIEQAYSIFQENLARLKRDYLGMGLYRKLLQEKMVSPPYVSRTRLGVTGNGSDMRINDQILRITVLPKLQTNSSRWQAVVIKNHDH